MEAIHGGERAAMRRLYDRYADYAMAVGLRYIPERDAVRDVLQDSFVKILTSIGQFSYRGEGSLKAWVARIVSNRAVDYLREHQRFVFVSGIPDECDEDGVADGYPDGETVGYSDVGHGTIGHGAMPADVSPDMLMELIGRLPDNYRTVLNLFVFEERSHREIAQLLGIKESTSSSQFFRAKKLLAKNIREYLNKQGT